MKIVTIQNGEVLKDIINNGLYLVDESKSKYLSFKDSYDTMKRLIKERFKVEVLPIWGFYKVHNEEPSTNMNWNYYDGKGATIDEESVLIELEVDEDISLIMDYYQWTDYMFFSEEGDIESANIALNHLFNLDQADTIQVCIPYIKKEMIRGVYNNKGDLIWKLKTHKNKEN